MIIKSAVPNRRVQLGGIGIADILVLVVLAISIVYLANYWSPANANDVQSLVKKAEGNEQAFAVLTEALKKSPTPSNAEMSELRRKVDRILVAHTVQQVTGDHSLGPTTGEAQISEDSGHASPEQTVFWGAVVATGVLVCILFLKTLRR